MPVHSGAVEVRLQFSYGKKVYSCIAFTDTSDQPCYIFVILEDSELISKFGDEIAIKTDLIKRLPRKDDYLELFKLRQGIFDSCKAARVFESYKLPAAKKRERVATKSPHTTS